jgi:DNA-directed RNA polymerase specialized sigma24 family protein
VAFDAGGASGKEARVGNLPVPEYQRSDPSASLAADAFIRSLEPELAAYARLRAADAYRTAKEYAAALGVDVPTIRNYTRRIRRRRRQWNPASH